MNFNKITAKSKGSKFLLGLLIVAFTLSSLSGIIFMTNKYNLLVIDDKKININEYINILNKEKQQTYYLNPTEEQINIVNSREFMYKVAEDIINSNLVSKEIENYNLETFDKIVLSILAKEKYFYTNNKFDIKKLQVFLENYKMTEYEYIQLLKGKYSSEFLQSLIIGNVNINNYIVESVFNEENKYKTASIFSINKNLIKIDNYKVSQEEIEKYYNDNITDFMVPESRKIDYIEIKDFKKEDSNKIEELLLISDNIEDIAKSMNIKVNTLGYIDKNNINIINEKYKYINETFSYKLNDFSNIKLIDNNLYVFSVVDIKNSKVKELSEVTKEINNIISNNIAENKYKEIINNYIDDYKNNNFNSQRLINRGFKIRNLQVYKGIKNNYKQEFINNILNTNIKNVSNIFIDNNNIYFAYVRDEGLINKSNDNYINIDSIKEDITITTVEDLQKSYVNYLRNNKYKIKTNYKLLNLIK